MNRILYTLLVAGSSMSIAVAGCSNETSGSGGSGGSSAGGSSAGGSSAGGSGSTEASAAVRAGVMIGSCIPDDGVTRTIASLYESRGSLESIDVACFEGAKEACASVTVCAGLSADNAGPCQPACLGETLEVCDDAWHFQWDCSKVGKTCSSDAVDCVDAITGQSCEPASYAPSCDGDSLVECEGGAEIQTDCGDSGLTCQEIEPGWLGCTGSGAACDVVSAAACDGDELVSCVGGAEHRVTCSDLDPSFSCRNPFGEAFCGVADDCQPATDNLPHEPERCEGDDIVFCHAGKLERVSCPSLGFARCEELPNETAVCAPTGILP